MLGTSSTATVAESNATTNGRSAVAMFTYQGHNLIMAKPKFYPDAIKHIKEAFHLAPDAQIVLKTSTLDICRDTLAVIHPSAYPHIWGDLDTILVSTTDGPGIAEAEPKTSTSVLPTQEKGKAKGRVSATPQISASGSRRVPKHSVTPRPSQLIQSHFDASDAQPRRGSRYASVEPQPVVEEQDEQQGQGHVEDLDVFEDAQEADKPHSPKKPSPPKHVDDVFSAAPVEAAGPTASKSKSDSIPPTPSSATRYRSQLEEELFPESPLANDGASVKQERTPVQETPTSRRSTRVRATASITSSTTGRSTKPKASTRETSSASVVSTTIDPNARIGIFISGPDPETQSAQFKMRGRHTVHKILKTACQSFGLDLDKASLHLVKRVDEDDDEDDEDAEVEHVLCPNDYTAADCGLEDGARMVIHIEGDDEDEDDYDDYA